MTAEQAPRAIRHNIALVGCSNVGKSSLINALVGQDISIVSEYAGTTTDAVYKPYELLPLGPVTFIDTAGLDDDTEIGQLRIKSTKKALYRTDMAILVVAEKGITDFDKNIIRKLEETNIPFIVVFNKTDINKPNQKDEEYLSKIKVSYAKVSSAEKQGIENLKDLIIKTIPEENKKQTPLLDGLVRANDKIILVTPIDSSAPKGRLILPQVQVLREILDLRAISVVTQVEELSEAISSLQNAPKIIITDSQAIHQVNKIVPQNIPLTTFSILFARFKGDLQTMVEGAGHIDKLVDGSKVLIAEACSHHTQEDDIAKVKIPQLLRKYTNKNINFHFCTGSDFPENLEEYSLVVHCGACMLNKIEMNRRLKECLRRNIPITNYGVAISKAQGILDRVVEPFRL